MTERSTSRARELLTDCASRTGAEVTPQCDQDEQALGQCPIWAYDLHIRSIGTVDQDRRAAELRLASLTYAAIGERPGIDDSTAFRPEGSAVA
jgi:hypothetical protein